MALHRSSEHSFTKPAAAQLSFVPGMGVEGDAHFGATVRHRSRVAIDPDQPNLRQVHLLAQEVLDELRRRGFPVAPGELGENITTTGVDLHALPTGTQLRVGESVLLAVTGLRTPCQQIEAFRTGLLDEVRDRADDGTLVRRAGVMAIVLQGGVVAPGDRVAVQAPPPPLTPLARV